VKGIIFFSRVIIIVNVEMKSSMIPCASLRNYYSDRVISII